MSPSVLWPTPALLFPWIEYNAAPTEDHGSSSANRGKTWRRIRGFNFKWGHRVIPDPYNPKMIYIATFGGSVWHGPATGDPNAAEDIAGPPLLRYSKD